MPRSLLRCLVIYGHIGPRAGAVLRHLDQPYQPRPPHRGEELLAVGSGQAHHFAPHRAAGDEARGAAFLGGDPDDVGELVERHARGQDRPRPVQDRRQSPAAFRRTGVLQLEQVDVQVIESPGRLDNGVFASLAAQIFSRPRVDEVLDDHRDTGGAAVADDLVADGERLGDQVWLTGGRGRAVGTQLDEELEGVAALVQDPLGVQGRVAVGTRLALVAAPLGRFGRDEQPAVGGQRLRLGDGRDAVGRVGQQAGGGGRQDAGDVRLRDAQVVVAARRR